MMKKATSRTSPLNRIRHNITPYTAKTIYQVMILPTLLYCSNIFISMSDTKKREFENIQARALKIINGPKGSVRFPLVQQICKRKCAIDVFKCLTGLAPSPFNDYFIRTHHSKNTRGNHSNLVLPRVKTEFARKSFTFQGAKIFNNLPDELKLETSILRFKVGLNGLII